jgi:hypothetical protein
MEEIGEIRGAINSFRNDTGWLALRARWNKDFGLYRLKPYDAGKGRFSYTSNETRNLVNMALGMLTDARLAIRVPSDELDDDGREAANNIERLHYGVLNLNDDAMAKLPDMPAVRDQMAWYGLVRGSFAIRPYVYKDSKGETITDFAVWDIYNIAFGKGNNGLAWAAYTYKMTKQQVKEIYGLDVAEDNPEVTDFWDTKNNGIIISNQWAKKLEPHGLDYCPVFIIRAGAMPPVWQIDTEDTTEYFGESLLASIRDITPLYNKTISDYLTIVRRGAKPPLGVWSSGGERQIDEDIYQIEEAAMVPMDSDTGEKIEPLIQPTMPADAGALVNIISGEIQRGGLSHVAQGELGFRLSGFAINQLRQAISTVVIPYARMIEQAYRVGLVSIQEQYAAKSWKPLKIRGRTSRNVAFGYPQAMQLKPADVKGDWFPEIRLKPVLPKDDAQQYELAYRATQSEKPILSMETAREELVGIEDTALEEERVSREWAEKLPINRLYKAMLAALAAGREDIAYNLVAMAAQMMGQVPQGRGQPGKQPTGLEQLAAENAGTGMPPGDVGFSPETLPSESLGGLPSGARGAAPPPEAGVA